MTTANVTVKLTPAMMAEAFWGLSSGEQADFLDQLAMFIKRDHEYGNTSAYSLGELQWYYLGEELERPYNKAAKEMLMTIAAPLYMHTLLAIEKS